MYGGCQCQERSFRKNGKVTTEDTKIDWTSMEISLINVIGYSRDDFFDMTLVEIVESIRTYKRMNPVDENSNNNKKPNKKQQKSGTSSEFFSFGRAPELDR